jgi:hypothetical protein
MFLFVFVNVLLGALTEAELSIIKDEYIHSDYVERKKQWGDGSVKMIYYYEGGEIPEAWMVFLNNGVMALKSTLFSRNIHIYSYVFFEYKVIDELIEVSLIDSRLNEGNWLSTREYGSDGRPLRYGIPEKNAIILDTSNGYIQFALLRFYPTRNAEYRP